MPHIRKRHVLPTLLKRLRLSRVVAIQGCRQSGKSFLARNLLVDELSRATYVTFDQKAIKTFAIENPESFLAKHSSANTLIIDEAQKVPDIFDAIKYQVDQNSRPGQYTLLGSTEFSKLLKIRESLTGRMSRVRLYSLNLAECLELEPSRSSLAHPCQTTPRITRGQLMHHLERGGFPGIFAIRETTARKDFLRDWLDLTLERDLQTFPGIQVDADLAERILMQIATLEEPNAAQIAARLKKTTRQIQRILSLLETLFVIHKLEPHPSGTGKPLYFLCDVSLAFFFGADFERQLWTWILHEQLSQRSYRNDREHRLFYYRNTKGSILHLVTENIQSHGFIAARLLAAEKFDKRDFELLKSFRSKTQSTRRKVELIALGPVAFNMKKEKVRVFQWDSIA